MSHRTEAEATSVDDAIFLLFSEGIITARQRYYCDKKMCKKFQKEGLIYYKKIRE